jgi:hypothetical protein
MSNGPSGAGELSARQVGSLAGDSRASGRTGAAQSTASPAQNPEPAPDQPMTLEQPKPKAETVGTEGPGRVERWLKYLGVVVPLVAAVIAAFIQWSGYWDQRERLAQFQAGEQVIKLATQLNHPSDEGQRSLAALELAWYGRPAVFLLFEQLVPERAQAVRHAIIMALAEIARNDTKPRGIAELLARSPERPSIIVLLARSADASLRVSLNAEKPSVDSIERRLVALADTAAAIQRDDTADPEFLAIVTAISERIASQPSERLSEADKQRLLGVMERRFQAAA